MRIARLAHVLGCSLLVLTGACSSSPCSGVTGTCVPFAAGATENDISAALVQAAPNTTFAFAAGVFKFQNSLNLANVSGITVQGAGNDKVDVTKQTVLDFSTVVGSGEGIVADHTDSIVFTNFIARDTKGNGIKVINSNGVTWRGVRTLWTNPDGHTHGAYGLYPVQSQNVLIENCEVAGAADAGVYVGQSDKIIVRNNDVHDCVAGIEIENSSHADVHDNMAHGNVGGVLIFNMPDLAVNEGGWNHVYKNTIDSNNTVNFAKRGSSVARVPGGTGAFVLAGHDIEVDHNTITNNNAAAFSVISYVITGDSRLADPTKLQYGYGAKMWPARVYVHDNTFMDNGSQPMTPNPTDCPDPTVMNPASDCPDPVAWELAQVLFATKLYVNKTPGVADTVYDGVLDPTAMASTWGGTMANPMNVCFGNNGSVPFLNMKFDQAGPLLLSSDTQKQLMGLMLMSTDATPYACTLPALPAITVTAR